MNPLLPTRAAPAADPAAHDAGGAAGAVRGRSDLEPFWPSRQPHLFDQTCPGSPSASRLSAR
ncbi:hypothetical protein RMN57_29935 [Kitasatospora sp. CM 4170]|uniref:Uncharacterized protein n=1 Tax=Kitasatospora aburaviensis TaxID=67265 RepID=A0ABW1EPA4_9ACTN|nr:hypothetical protein [Kitasatospora sp. CM 4170]WNM48610.1 hypothetical protein RMN57_29935 [Kitasatospora sp. CM 4170]